MLMVILHSVREPPMVYVLAVLILVDTCRTQTGIHARKLLYSTRYLKAHSITASAAQHRRFRKTVRPHQRFLIVFATTGPIDAQI